MLLLACNMDDSNRNDKSIQAHTCFTVWKQNILDVYTIILTHIILISFWIFIYLQQMHFIEIWVTGMIYDLSDSLLTFFNCFIFTSIQTLSKQFDVFRKSTPLTSQKSQ